MKYVLFNFLNWIGLISSTKYWREARKRVIQVKFYFDEILKKIQTRGKGLNFLRT